MFEFQKLTVYIKAKAFYKDTRNYSKNNRLEKCVENQLHRAALSIVLNIAEGSGRSSKADRRRFFVMSRGSVFESVAILDLLCDDERIETEQFSKFHQNADELSRMLYTMICNLGS